ncbi:MAG: hypothetical protein II650_00755, partial [Clostridia bacterium]|nr:hypothetical protein [Clostridia bacterium]
LWSRPEGQKTFDLVGPKSASASAQTKEQAKKASDLQDPSSASVSAQAKHDCNRTLAGGELAFCPRGLPARKRQRANKGRETNS